MVLARCNVGFHRVSLVLAVALALVGLGPKGAVADQTLVAGQAIVCVRVEQMDALYQVVDSVEPIVNVDDGVAAPESCELCEVRSSSRSGDDLVDALRGCEGVVFAEVDGFVEADLGEAEPTDDPETQSTLAEDLHELGGLTVQSEATRRDYTPRQYAFNGSFGIDVPQWNTYDGEGQPTPKVSADGRVVAVLDTGVDYNHEDLRDVMWNEGEDYPELVELGGGEHGINVAPPRKDGTRYDTTDPMDDDRHGTHVAGVVAAEWNGRGVGGAACGAKIMAVKLMNDAGAMTISDALRAYAYVIAAQRAGVDVAAINNSWGDFNYSRALDMAAREAGRLGAVTVFAASNDAADIDMAESNAHSFVNNPYAVVVGGTDEKGQMGERSCFGRRSVHVFAPGERILSTVPTNKGPADEDAEPLVNNGVAYACDFESIQVADNADNGVFGLAGQDGTTLQIADEGHDSAHALRLTKTGAESNSCAVSFKELAAGDDCRGLSFWIKASATESVEALLTYNTVSDGSSEDRSTVQLTDDSWQQVTLPISATADKSKLKLSLSLSSPSWEGKAGVGALVDDIILVAQTSPYELMTGTSQASPAVAGGAAVLAAAFPDDGADVLAARIIGSTKPVPELADKSVSGGIFSLEKALDLLTNPVLGTARALDGRIVVTGYFFGDTKGTLKVSGQELEVISWSNDSIDAKLPADLSEGERLVEVTTNDGRRGHQRFCFGTPSSLYQRLPLPGQDVSGNPGDYVQTTDEVDQTFYVSTPRALVGLDGYLYYLLETPENTLAMYRYDIASQDWEAVFTDDYAPGGGACTWDGKILFVAGQEQESKTYLGLFDPATGAATYSLINSEWFEREASLVNTGKGILLAGGHRRAYGSVGNTSVEVVRTVDPATMTLAEVAMPGQTRLSDSWYGAAYDSQGNGYFLGGETMRGLYKFSFGDTGVTCTVLEEGSISGERGDRDDGMGPQADGTLLTEQSLRMAVGSTKDGIMASGPVMTDAETVVTADTYSMPWDQTKLKACDKRVSLTKVYNPMGTAYRGAYYVIGDTDSQENGRVFIAQSVETLEQPGDTDASETEKVALADADAGTTSLVSLPQTGDELGTAALVAGIVGLAVLAVARVAERATR